MMRNVTQAIIIGSVFCFLRPNIKNKQPSKKPTLGASEPSISGAPAREIPDEVLLDEIVISEGVPYDIVINRPKPAPPPPPHAN